MVLAEPPDGQSGRQHRLVQRFGISSPCTWKSGSAATIVFGFLFNRRPHWSERDSAAVIAVTAYGGAMRLRLPHNTSVLVYPDKKNLPRTVEVVQGVRAMPLVLALCRAPPVFFEKQPLNAEIALRAMKSTDDLVRVILESESASALAARFAGAYEFLGDQDRAAQITRTLDAAGITVHPKKPFTREAPVFAELKRLTSPYAGRIEALFRVLREPVLEVFKDLPSRPVSDPDAYIQHLESVTSTTLTTPFPSRATGLPMN